MRQDSEVTLDSPRINVRSFPNLFVAGAAKSGTTSLYYLFAAHPEIYVPQSVKETNFMSYPGQRPQLKGPRDEVGFDRSVVELDQYIDLYSGWSVEPYAADNSPSYLLSTRAAENIKTNSPNAKIIIVLRNPVEAAYSMYMMKRRSGREPLNDFSAAFEASEETHRAWLG